jgi:IS5 family transposase
MAASKSPSKKALLSTAYSELLERAGKVLQLARELVKTAIKEHGSRVTALQTKTIELWIDLTSQVCDTAFRRVLLGESVPSSEKLFSLFETHTQLYRRGKVGQANQFGRLALVYEDGAGFISHYHLMDREATDKDVVVEQTVVVMDKHNGAIESASFDRGFYSKENEQALQELVGNVCVLPRAPSEYAERLKTADIKFHKTRLHHSGIESAIGAMQRGNGLKRCRDKSEVGFERYFGLGVLGRNIHTLGKLLLARDHANSLAATNRRKAA